VRFTILRLLPVSIRQFFRAGVHAAILNTVSFQRRRGRDVVVKRRNGASRTIGEMANFYFRVSGVPIRFWSEPRQWQDWEVRCYQMLNPGFNIFALGNFKVVQDCVPGTPLFEHLHRRTLTSRMLRGAAKELRRAHSMPCDFFNGVGWSHGDATMSNVLYHKHSDRARLIDFEIAHDPSLPARTRHADDLLVFLLDLVGARSCRRWLAWALLFLRTYGDPEVVCEMKKILKPPPGLARIWWRVRTNFLDFGMVSRRLRRLREALDQGAACEATTSSDFWWRRPPCHRRLPSTTCQATSPGTPYVSSRARRTSERAKPVVEGIPRREPTPM
jgi:hypothetical protein